MGENARTPSSLPRWKFGLFCLSECIRQLHTDLPVPGKDNREGDELTETCVMLSEVQLCWVVHAEETKPRVRDNFNRLLMSARALSDENETKLMRTNVRGSYFSSFISIFVEHSAAGQLCTTVIALKLLLPAVCPFYVNVTTES